VSYYERTEREFDIHIHNRNNASYVDDLFKDAMFREGLFVFRGPARSTLAVTNEADSLLLANVRGGYANAPDSTTARRASSRRWPEPRWRRSWLTPKSTRP
ncbi:MAG: hypothetical protein HKN04_02860, partial [Rhodothermaceae bacterium]|nr:hypothetical protein [Rhodothermaceae bacterium]